jgi:hypothetical protein
MVMIKSSFIPLIKFFRFASNAHGYIRGTCKLENFKGSLSICRQKKVKNP